MSPAKVSKAEKSAAALQRRRQITELDQIHSEINNHIDRHKGPPNLEAELSKLLSTAHTTHRQLQQISPLNADLNKLWEVIDLQKCLNDAYHSVIMMYLQKKGSSAHKQANAKLDDMSVEHTVAGEDTTAIIAQINKEADGGNKEAQVTLGFDCVDSFANTLKYAHTTESVNMADANKNVWSSARVGRLRQAEMRVGEATQGQGASSTQQSLGFSLAAFEDRTDF